MYQHDDYSSQSDKTAIEDLEVPTHSDTPSEAASEDLNIFPQNTPASGGLNLYASPEQSSEGYDPYTVQESAGSASSGPEPRPFNVPEPDPNTGSAPPPEDLAKSKPISDLLNDLQNPLPGAEHAFSAQEAASVSSASVPGNHQAPSDPRGTDDLQVFPRKAEPETLTPGSSAMPKPSFASPAPSSSSASVSANDENIWLDVIAAHPELNYLQAEILRLVCTGRELPRARSLLERLIAQNAA